MTKTVLGAPSEQDLKGILERIRAETQVPGLGVAVSVGGRRAAAYAGQPMLGKDYRFSERSRFEMSCLMKLFSSLTVLELHWDGIIDIGQPIQEYLPEFPVALGATEAICVYHLLNHTAGYRGVDISNSEVRWSYSWERFLKHCEANGRNFTPGTVFNYEHSEHVILGEIIRRRCGKSAPAVIKERIWDRLGIQPSSAKADLQEGVPYVAQHSYDPARSSFTPTSLPGFGPFWSSSLPDATLSLLEALTLGEALLEHWHSQARSRIFSDSTVVALRRPGPSLPAQVASGLLSEQVPMSFGLGLGHYDDGVFGHNGSMSGQTCTLRIDPSRQVAIAVGVNAWSPYARDSAVGRTLAFISGTEDMPDNAPATADRTPFQLEQLLNGFSTTDIAGRYVGSYFGEINVNCSGEAIHFDLGPERAKRPRISALRDDRGDYAIDSGVPVLAGFFKDPDSGGSPALMMGVHAYKKAS